MKKTVAVKIILISALCLFSLSQHAGAQPEIPEGATVVSAVLGLHGNYNNAQTVNVHRITGAWSESEVTWNTIPGFDPAVENVFTSASYVWCSVNLTDLVQSWVDGSNPNYGVLLEHGTTLYTSYKSSEYSVAEQRPKLEICYYTDNPADITCIVIQRQGVVEQEDVADAYVWNLYPDYNGGDASRLMTGLRVDDTVKLALVRFDFVLVAPPPPPSSSFDGCETAFAFGGGTNEIDDDTTHSFLDIDEDGNGKGDFRRWGWSIGQLGPGSYEFDIYAGAGQSDIAKGTLVGMLFVDYDGSTATVTYYIDPGYGLKETHLYVGNEILPRNVKGKKGNYTVSPGQYPLIHEKPEGAAEDTFEIPVSGDIYIVAHAVVCGY